MLHLPSSSVATVSFFGLRRFVHLLNKKNKANGPGDRRRRQFPTLPTRTTSMGASWQVPIVTSTDRIVLRS